MLSTPLIQHFNARTPLRAGSLIVTVFGDCIAPRGGTVWLGSLIEVLSHLGISERLVRTSVFRLIQEGILVSKRNGRRSFYALSAEGQQNFQAATKRIYAMEQPIWDGRWTLLLLTELSKDEKTDLSKTLRSDGFRMLGANLLGSPTKAPSILQSRLRSRHYSKGIIHLDAMMAGAIDAPSLENLIATAWELQELRNDYETFLELFNPVMDAISKTREIKNQDAFFLRTFLIHEFRKVILRDPSLPQDLLPTNWPGNKAKQLAARLYQRVLARSEIYIYENLTNESGPLPKPKSSFFARFGGLEI